MVTFRHLITIPLGIWSFFTTFYAVGRLTQFLSTPMKIKTEYVWLLNLMDNISRFELTIYPITIDILLIIGFILQHSLMKSAFVKSIWNAIGLKTAERCIYNLMTSFTLMYLIDNWKTAPGFLLWSIDIENNKTLWWAFLLVHIISWTVIYGGSILMDLPEILGLKQIYYDVNIFQSPISYKSVSLNMLYEHVRHPSFIGFTTILWVTNLMSLDRLILATFWTLYMYIAWTPDKYDVNYQQNQLYIKRNELIRRSIH